MSAPKCICWKPTAPHQPDCPMGKPVKVYFSHQMVLSGDRPIARVTRVVENDEDGPIVEVERL